MLGLALFSRAQRFGLPLVCFVREELDPTSESPTTPLSFAGTAGYQAPPFLFLPSSPPAIRDASGACSACTLCRALRYPTVVFGSRDNSTNLNSCDAGGYSRTASRRRGGIDTLKSSLKPGERMIPLSGRDQRRQRLG